MLTVIEIISVGIKKKLNAMSASQGDFTHVVLSNRLTAIIMLNAFLSLFMMALKTCLKYLIHNLLKETYEGK